MVTSTEAVPAVATVPLNAVDELCLHLDSERFPWTIELEVRVAGTIDATRLRAAVREAMRRHPMARARLRPYRFTDRTYAWEIAEELGEDPVWILHAADDDEMARRRAAVLSAGVPLDAAPPFRVWLVRRPGGDSLLLSTNHVATDGMGTIRLLRSIVRAYAGADDPVPAIGAEASRDVGEVAGPTSLLERVERLVGFGAGLRHAGGRLSRVCVDGGEPTAGGFGFHHLRVDADAFGQIDPTRHGEATVNDILLAALHLAIDDWNADHAAETDRITVMMPVNLRPRDTWTETVANLSLQVQVHSSPTDRDDAASLVRAVAAQTRRAKRTNAATVLLEVLDRQSWLPSVAKQAIPLLSPLASDALVDTAVVSNVGRLDEPFDFADVATGPVTEVWFSPPARMPLGIGVGAATVHGALHLSIRYCNAQFDAEAAAAFAGYLRRALDFVG